MTPCSRFEEEALLVLEQGEELEEHFFKCDDCIAARASYGRLQEALTLVGGDYEPNPVWRMQLRSMIGRDHVRNRSRRWILSIAACLAITLGGVLVFRTVRNPSTPQVAFFQELVAGEGVRLRGETVQPGVVLSLRATTGGARYGELRVYRSDRIAHRIVGSREGAPELTARIVLQQTGSYQAVLITSGSPIPPPQAGLDADAGAALNTGASIELADPIDVR